MEYLDLLNYYKNKGVLNRLLKDRKINSHDVIFRDDFIKGLWDTKNDMPMKRKKLIVVSITCKNCGREHKTNYKVWENKKMENKFICSNCARSRCMTTLNKTIIKDKNIKFWSSTESSELRKKFSEARIEYNKNKLREVNLLKTKEEKEVIKNKKRITWYSRPLEERIEITQKRLKGALQGIETNTGVRYDSSYEKFFIEEIAKHHMNISRGPRIPYFYKNFQKLFFCDFVVDNILVEIKSTWTYKKTTKNT